MFNKLYNLRTESGQDPFFLYQEEKVTKRWLIQKIVGEINADTAKDGKIPDNISTL